MDQTIHLLIVEDSEMDVILLLRALRRGNYQLSYEVVDNANDMRAALERCDWDVITSDHAIPGFSAPAALALAHKIRPEVPFIIVSGDIDTSQVVALMRGGAQDYVPKRELELLSPTIERELGEVKLRRERNQAAAEIIRLNNELGQRVRESTLELEKINQDLEAFNVSVSHDLHAPLRQLRSYVDNYLEDFPGQQSVESLQLLQRVRASVDHMNTLIDALMGLAHFLHRDLNGQIVDLSALVHQITAELQASEPGRRVEFVISEDVRAHGDAQLLHILLENLLSNAWKFSMHVPVARIEFGVIQQVGGCPVYIIRDNGVGFDMTYADKLFAPFQRLHNSKEFPGTGIGLSTVERIVRRHNGRVWAEGKVGEGAVFYFTIGGCE